MPPPNPQAGFSTGVYEITGRKAAGLAGDSSTTRRYLITGAEDEEDAIELLGLGTPTSIGNLVPTQPDIEEVVPLTGTYIATIQYRPPESPEVEREKENSWPPSKLVPQRLGDSTRWSWKTQAQQFQIAATAPNKVSFFGSAAKKRDFNGAIGVDPDDGQVDGTTRYFFGEEWTADKVVAKSAVNQSFLDSLRALRGKTNQSSFAVAMFTTGNAINFPAKSALFLGTEGTEEEDAIRMRFHFIMGENESSVAVGGISGITKNAHDYLWPLWEKLPDATTGYITRQAAQVYVHEIYDPADFSFLATLLA
jgi:hypothetical protein